MNHPQRLRQDGELLPLRWRRDDAEPAWSESGPWSMAEEFAIPEVADCSGLGWGLRLRIGLLSFLVRWPVTIVVLVVQAIACLILAHAYWSS